MLCIVLPDSPDADQPRTWLYRLRNSGEHLALFG
eukprot:COSAG02_NODE_58843_length_276_cov_0.587571_1_plen_33_part_01